MSQALIETIHWEINLDFAVSLLFPFVTRFFWPWNESWWGWNTVLLELSIAGALFPAFLRLDFGFSDQPLEWTQVMFLGLVVFNVVWRTVMIWRTQRAGARPEELAEEEAGLPGTAARPSEPEGV